MSQFNRAIELIKAERRKGPRKSADLFALAAKAADRQSDAEKAKKTLGLAVMNGSVFKKDNVWYWQLPEETGN